jgi:hypothetical protein
MQFEERSRRLQLCRLNHQTIFLPPPHHSTTESLFISTVTDHGFNAPETLSLTHLCIFPLSSSEQASVGIFEFEIVFSFPYCIVIIIIVQRRKSWYSASTASLAASSSSTHVNWHWHGRGTLGHLGHASSLARAYAAYFFTIIDSKRDTIFTKFTT